jgi:hypothetical protein
MDFATGYSDEFSCFYRGARLARLRVQRFALDSCFRRLLRFLNFTDPARGPMEVTVSAGWVDSASLRKNGFTTEAQKESGAASKEPLSRGGRAMRCPGGLEAGGGGEPVICVARHWCIRLLLIVGDVPRIDNSRLEQLRSAMVCFCKSSLSELCERTWGLGSKGGRCW